MDIEVSPQTNAELGLLKTWKPHPRQEEFIRLPDSIFEGFFGGAAGGGKSEVLDALPLVRGWYNHPRFRGIIFRRTYPELEKSHIARTNAGLGIDKDGNPGPSYWDFGGKYNKQDKRWTFKSGAVLEFGYSENERDVDQYDTSEYHYMGFDELTHFTRGQYTYLLSRIRTTDPSLPRIARSGSNPGNIGHAWVKERFVEPHRPGRKIIRMVWPDGKVSKLIFIPSKLWDNPSLVLNDPQYEINLRNLDEANRKAKLEGDWDALAGQVFTEFRAMHYSDEPPNAIHVIPYFHIPSWWPKILAIDWGHAAMTWAALAAVAPDGRVYIYKEYWSYKKSIMQWSADIREMCQGENIVTAVIDPSANKSLGFENTIKEQVMKATGLFLEDADNDRIGGKMLIHDFLRFKQLHRPAPKEGFSPARAAQILRNRSPQEYEEYINYFKPAPLETNIPRLQIFEQCEKLIATIPRCIYADPKRDKKVEDVKEFDGDDPYDGLRYLLKAVDRYVQSAKELGINLHKRDAVISKFQESGDYNAFDRALSRLEAEEGHGARSVPIYHRRRTVRVGSRRFGSVYGRG